MNMLQLSPDNIPSWQTSYNQGLHPSAIDITCPHCNRWVTFSTPHWHNTQAGLEVANVTCPACMQPVKFLLFERSNDDAPDVHEAIYIYPSPQVKVPLSGLKTDETFSAPLMRTYKSLLRVYNAREWNATAILAKKLLEGIIQNVFIDESNRLPLAKQLEKLADLKVLSRPLLGLADGMRHGGGLGAHFELIKEPDNQVAELMLELTEELLEYLFVLPRRIDELHARIEALSKADIPTGLALSNNEQKVRHLEVISSSDRVLPVTEEVSTDVVSSWLT